MEDELLEAGQAAKYLATRWGVESYSADAFKMLRRRWGIQPAFSASNSTFWRKSDLDKIPKPDRSRSRPSRKKKMDGQEQEEGEGGKRAGTSMLSADSRPWLTLPSEEIPDLELESAVC